jgi:hypothetical protein
LDDLELQISMRKDDNGRMPRGSRIEQISKSAVVTNLDDAAIKERKRRRGRARNERGKKKKKKKKVGNMCLEFLEFLCGLVVCGLLSRWLREILLTKHETDEAQSRKSGYLDLSRGGLQRIALSTDAEVVYRLGRPGIRMLLIVLGCTFDGSNFPGSALGRSMFWTFFGESASAW